MGSSPSSSAHLSGMSRCDTKSHLMSGSPKNDLKLVSKLVPTAHMHRWQRRGVKLSGKPNSIQPTGR